MLKILGLLRLTRPANIVTAIADILAGAAIAGWVSDEGEPSSLLYLSIATIGLYGGGVVFNDVFDAALDKAERPERPIPSGLVSVREAATLGIVLICAGILSACFHSVYPSGAIALAITIAALVYDKWGKHHNFVGPLNMGLCRGLNLLLGISLVPGAITVYGFLAVVPIVYIAAITMISRGEVHGGKTNTLVFAAILYAVVIACILLAGYVNENVPYTLLFLVIFGTLIFPPLLRAIGQPIGKNIGKAVKAGVLALIAMNAAWAAAFDNLPLAVITILLLPVSILLAKAFAVT